METLFSLGRLFLFSLETFSLSMETFPLYGDFTGTLRGLFSMETFSFSMETFPLYEDFTGTLLYGNFFSLSGDFFSLYGDFFFLYGDFFSVYGDFSSLRKLYQCFNWHCSTEILRIVLCTAHPLGWKYNMKPLLMCQCKCTYVDMSVDMSFDFTFLSTKFLQLEFMFYPKFYPHVCRIMEPFRVLQVAGREPPLPRRRITMPQLGETKAATWETKREWAVAVKIVKWLRNSISFCSFWWYLISELATNHFLDTETSETV